MIEYWRALLGTCAILIMNAVGIFASLNSDLYLKILGYINYIISGMVVYFLAVQYQETPFYKSLGRDE